MPEQSKAKVRLVTHGKSKSSGTATLRVRKIRHSPVADPKKVKLVRQIVRELNQAKKTPKGASQAAQSRPEVPFVTAVR
jgi:hypothetical protein